MASIATIAELPIAIRAPARSRTRWRRPLVHMVVVGFLFAVVWGPAQVFIGDNVHAVIPGKIYRGAQPDAVLIRSLVRDHGVRTIVNLRGTCYSQDWYIEEAGAAQELGLAMFDVNFSAGRWPSHHEVRQLVEVLARADYPIYMHCRHGADRTGLASVIALMLGSDASYAQARGQLSLRYGHAPVGRSTVLDRFFDLYEEWARRWGHGHDRASFSRWLVEEYRGDVCQAVIEEATPLHAQARVGEPIAWRVRARNVTGQPWHFRPHHTAGIHVGFCLWDAEGKHVSTGRAGLLERTVVPGESITVTLVVPPVANPGRYRLLIDLVQEGHCWFYQTGSEPHEEEIDVRK